MAAVVLPKYTYNAGAGVVTITFTQPLAPDGSGGQFELKLHARDAFGGNGKRQRQKDYVEETIVLRHKYETETVRAALVTMMQTWVLLGNSFLYYPDATAGTNYELECLDTGFEYDRMFPNLAVYDFKIKARKKI